MTGRRLPLSQHTSHTHLTYLTHTSHTHTSHTHPTHQPRHKVDPGRFQEQKKLTAEEERPCP